MANESLSQTEAAYLAGLLDGEGYFGLVRLKKGPSHGHSIGYEYYQYFVRVVMTKRDFLEEIAAMITWSKARVCPEGNKLRGRAKPSYGIAWSGNIAEKLCRELLPYLRLKKPHAELLLWIADTKARAGKRYHGPGRTGSRYPLYMKKVYAEAFAQFRILNQRGQDNA